MARSIQERTPIAEPRSASTTPRANIYKKIEKISEIYKVTTNCVDNASDMVYFDIGSDEEAVLSKSLLGSSKSVASLTEKCGKNNLREFEQALREASLKECLREIDSDCDHGYSKGLMQNMHKSSFMSADVQLGPARPPLEKLVRKGTKPSCCNEEDCDEGSSRDKEEEDYSSDDKLSLQCGISEKESKSFSCSCPLS